MNIARIEPWSVFNLLNREFYDVAGRRPQLVTSDSNGDASWLPPVDIVEEKDRFVLRADVPGVNPDEITVNMDDGVLSLSGERSREPSDEADGIKRFERRSGKFYRRFTLPDSADADGISAKSANGILEISIPKQAQIQARRITVEAA